MQVIVFDEKNIKFDRPVDTSVKAPVQSKRRGRLSTKEWFDVIDTVHDKLSDVDGATSTAEPEPETE